MLFAQASMQQFPHGTGEQPRKGLRAHAHGAKYSKRNSTGERLPEPDYIDFWIAWTEELFRDEKSSGFR